MPVRSLRSSVLRWPGAEEVAQAVRAWAAEEIPRHAGLLRLGYFGSYARGDWGVGSDLDLVAVIEVSPEPFERRALAWDLDGLPVPSELLVYTREEWSALQRRNDRFGKVLLEEAVWVWPPPAKDRNPVPPRG